MAARYRRTGLGDLLVAAAQDLVHDLPGHGLGDGHDVERDRRLAAHGVDVGERVRCGDGAVGIGIVRDGREEIAGHDHGKVIGELVDRRVVALVEAHDEPGVALDGEVGEELREHSGAHLGTAARALRELGQLDIVHQSSIAPVSMRIASSTPPPTARALSEAQRM